MSNQGRMVRWFVAGSAWSELSFCQYGITAALFFEEIECGVLMSASYPVKAERS